MFSTTLKAVLFLTMVSLAVAQQARTVGGDFSVNGRLHHVVRMEDAKPANESDRVRFDNALATFDASTGVRMHANAVPTKGGRKEVTSHFAMVLTTGHVYDTSSLGIKAVVHTVIPRGSIVGLRIRYSSLSSKVEGTSVWDYDLLPGEVLNVKIPGGELLFESTKQYELVVLDSRTLTTTVDLISYYTGSGQFIDGSPKLSYSPKTGYMVMNISVNDNAQIDSVVIDGGVVPLEATYPNGSGITIELNRIDFCFGGDVLVTVVKIGGESDTVPFRMPSGPPRVCQAAGLK